MHAAGALGTLYIFDPVDTAARKAGNKDPFKLVRSLPIRVPAAASDSIVSLRSTLAASASASANSTSGGGAMGASCGGGALGVCLGSRLG